VADPLLKTLRDVVVIVAVSASSGFGLYASQEATATGTKAEYLYNFTKFIEWPEPAAPDEPFRLCVVNDDELRRAIEKTIEGESANGRLLLSLVPRTPQEAASCQVLFINRSDPDRAAKFIAATVDLPILTVGDAPQPPSLATDIEFVFEAQRLRFDVNLTGAERRGLKISSKLLRVARQGREVPK